jgi:nifR3 family TIM-barrel protein
VNATGTQASASSLRLGAVVVDPPVVLAPMAGVTDVAFRTLCRRHGGGLFVSEMVGARALVEGDPKTALKTAFGPDAGTRSIQLYATEPGEVEAAVGLLVDEGRVDHVDLNFGCPAPKVTRHGGGAALPWRLARFSPVVAAAVGAAGAVPVTVKLRLGIDDAHLTFRDAGLAAQRAGVAAVALHARTALQRYAGAADWGRIRELVGLLDVPVLGNGDVWEADDAVRMMAATGCHGVVVGRGCLGRPWLFRDLDAVFAGRPTAPPPTLGEVADLMVDHAQLLAGWFGEPVGLRRFRKHPSWYLQGFPVGPDLRRRLGQVSTLVEVVDLVAGLDRDVAFPEDVRRRPRGHTGGASRVPLPHGWLDGRVDDAGPLAPAAGEVVSGG